MDQLQPGGSSGRRFSRSVSPTGGLVIRRTPEPLSNQRPQPLPAPTGQPPYHLSLDSVLPAASMQAIRASGKLVFHLVGDTGGVKAPQSQEIVMMHMESDFAAPDPAARPAFFYHLNMTIQVRCHSRPFQLRRWLHLFMRGSRSRKKRSPRFCS
jgi:acid phosphatase type 7